MQGRVCVGVKNAGARLGVAQREGGVLEEQAHVDAAHEQLAGLALERDARALRQRPVALPVRLRNVQLESLTQSAAPLHAASPLPQQSYWAGPAHLGHMLCKATECIVLVHSKAARRQNHMT